MLFFFNDTATTEIYPLSLHDALPICVGVYGFREGSLGVCLGHYVRRPAGGYNAAHYRRHGVRSEEHTSELQSRQYLVCRLLLEKKKQKTRTGERDSW